MNGVIAQKFADIGKGQELVGELKVGHVIPLAIGAGMTLVFLANWLFG